MTIFLRESDVGTLATINMAIEAVEEAFRLQGEQNVDNAPRRRCRTGQGLLHVMSASLPTLHYAGLKSYTTVDGLYRFGVLLYKGNGELAAVIEANKLGQLRTGAASAIATKYMAREESTRLGIVGTGFQAKSQVQAICAVRPIKAITAYSRDPEKRAAFCKEMTELVGITLQSAETAEAAVREMDIVVTATDSKDPVLKGEWLSKGTHINAVGSNFLSKQEIDVEAVRKCACVVVDSFEQAMLESGDLACAAKEEAFYWEDARELGLVVIGDFPGREEEGEITLFESQGIALEDVALAVRVYEKAMEAGIGERLPF